MHLLPDAHHLQPTLITRGRGERPFPFNENNLDKTPMPATSTPTVQIVKASAGSGKTHLLTQEYLSAILDRGWDWRRTLAVTFTNKATAEMKSRIIEEIAAAAAGQGNRAEKAKAILSEMLHDYGSFGVSTIDSYLQGTLRALGREAGQGTATRVEMDDEAVLDAVCDRIMEKAGVDAALAERLRSLAVRQVENGRTWNVEGAVKEMARRFLDEPFLMALRREGSIVTDAAAVDRLTTETDAGIRAFEDALRQVGEEGLAAAASMGREVESFKGKSRGPLCVFRKWEAGEIKEPAARWGDAFAEVEGTEMEEPYLKATDLFGEPYRDYRGALLVRENLQLMALYAAIFDALAEWEKENDATLLRRSGAVLAGLLQDGDQDYVQQRTGKRIDMALLDEAQDTSVLQWENIRPAIQGAATRGGALVVGDVKQSIYRWRGSDWKLLAGKMQDSMSGARIEETTLSKNWRSGRAIVGFNNRIFGSAAEAIRSAGMEDIAARVEDAYSDCRQTVPDERETAARDGLVTVRLEDGEDWKTAALDHAVQDIRTLREQGYPYGAITVLVRRNREGADVARRLAEEDIPVVTDDALQVGANAATTRTAALLRHHCSPDDPVAALAVRVRGLPESVPAEGSVYETVAAAASAARPTAADMPFVQTMLDQALAWQKTGGASLAEFVAWWDKEGSHKSVGSADGQDAVRVMTIHKAKGLSLEAVIVPFASEPFATPPVLAPTIWCRARGRFAPLGLVPMRAYGKSLSGTPFEEDWMEERTCQWLDVLNMMYVATTRARRRLFLYMPKEEPSAGPQRFSSLLQTILSGEFDETGTWTSGEALPYEDKRPQAATATLPPVGFTPPESRLRLSLKGDAYFGNDPEEAREEITEG